MHHVVVGGVERQLVQLRCCGMKSSFSSAAEPQVGRGGGRALSALLFEATTHASESNNGGVNAWGLVKAVGGLKKFTVCPRFV